MQVSATNPKYATMDSIPEEAKKAAMAVFEVEVKGKPADMQEKILGGKLNAYFQDQVLLEQPYIKDDAKTVRDLQRSDTEIR